MKKLSLSLAVLTAMGSMLAMSTMAASGDGARQRVQAAVEERLEDMDSNGDGKISQEEFTSARTQRIDNLFSRFDKDHDGLLTKDELGAAMPQQGRGDRPAAGGGNRGQRAQGGFGGAGGGGRGGFGGGGGAGGGFGGGRGGPSGGGFGGGGFGGGGGRAVARGGVDRDAIANCIAKANPDADPLERQDPAGIADRFASFDTNGDGKLSKDELTTAVTARAQTQFAHLDKNADGYLDKSDRDAAQAEREATAKAVRDCMQNQR